ncbi:L,D-transpeptidase [Hyphomicrobium sp. LHD-15]|uniref:L,D-transpeptidase n=1 Tax=Hyphomicrobium sp. LHD-15 TaxID=3072142 RepID=UPI0035BE29CD
MPLRRLLLLCLALSLSGCATDNLDWLGIAHDVTDADRRNYAALERERFPIAAADLAKLDPKFRRQQVAYKTSEPAGTIVVDTPNRYLYLVSGNGRALRYGIEVGREGFGWSGAATIARKAEWPTWTPPAEMVARDPRTAPFAKGMPGGPENPLGARALYLYQGGRDTLYRIHGGGRPSSLGKATSSGCIRLLDHDAIDLFNRVPTGTRTVVLIDPILSKKAPEAEDGMRHAAHERGAAG